MWRAAWWIGAGIVVGGLGCGASGGSPICRESSQCPAGEACIDGRCTARTERVDAGDEQRPPDAGRAQLLELVIGPQDPEIRVIDGASAAVDFEVTARFSDGSTTAVRNAFWSAASARLGRIDASTGEFTARGDAGGTETITVEALGRSATTTVAVFVERTLLEQGVPADAPTRFGTPLADPEREAGLLYPLAGAVMPQNVFRPDVQWERGDPGDLYRVTLRSSHVRVVAYVAHDGESFGYHYAVDPAAWRLLADSSGGQAVTIEVERWQAATGQTIGGDSVDIQFANASITGSIYYWDLEAGRILRIRGDGTGLENVVPNPPPLPPQNDRCVACHTVSRDGRRMAVEMGHAGDGLGTVLDLTQDLTADPLPTVMGPGPVQFISASFNPDGSRLIANWRSELMLIDANGGGRITPAGVPLPSAAAGQPEWSPDGTAIVFVENHNGPFWSIDFTASDLGILPVTGPDAFGASSTLIAGRGRAIARPSWSPDSQWIAFQYGINSRSGEGATRHPATIRLIGRNGALVELPALNAGAENSYYPTFSPFDEGGYFWLAFFSTRDYGNAQVGTRGTARRQLWVAAISNRPQAGVDPSHPPYWLPQQDVAHANMAAFWAREACRADGRTCVGSSECCSGFCRDVANGPVCVPPEVAECSQLGEACGDDSDCCEGAGSCAGNVCSTLE